jgi:hypothetical protein
MYSPTPSRRRSCATRAGRREGLVARVGITPCSNEWPGHSSRVMQMEDAMKARCLVAMMLTATAVAGAKEPLSIRVSPAFSFAPANLVIRTSVEPDAENRSLEVVADSAEFYRSSTITLEGDRAPKTMMVEFRSLPPGDYKVTAGLIGVEGHRRAIAHAHLNVLESGAAR